MFCSPAFCDTVGFPGGIAIVTGGEWDGGLGVLKVVLRAFAFLGILSESLVVGVGGLGLEFLWCRVFVDFPCSWREWYMAGLVKDMAAVPVGEADAIAGSPDSMRVFVFALSWHGCVVRCDGYAGCRGLFLALSFAVGRHLALASCWIRWRRSRMVDLKSSSSKSISLASFL